jgi:hypothetical protein
MNLNKRFLYITILTALVIALVPINALAGSVVVGGYELIYPEDSVTCKPSDTITVKGVPQGWWVLFRFIHSDGTAFYPLGSVWVENTDGGNVSVDFPYGGLTGFFGVNIRIATKENGAPVAQIGSEKWSVTCEPPPPGKGCTLTPGYWKTHSMYGPAPYDVNWDHKDGGAAEFLGTEASYYEVLWTPPKRGNAFLILSHAFIAAELNVLNGASMPGDVQDAYDQAKVLLISYEDSMRIPKKSADRISAIQLAEILDEYNNGYIGPGHCP